MVEEDQDVGPISTHHLRAVAAALRAFGLPNPHPEVVTNSPLYYYTGGKVLDAEKNFVFQYFAPPMLAPGEEPWKRLDSDIEYGLAGGIWRKAESLNDCLRFAFNKERERQGLPADGEMMAARSTNRPATTRPPLRSRGQPFRERGQAFGRGQSFGKGQPLSPRGAMRAKGSAIQVEGQTRNYNVTGW